MSHVNDFDTPEYWDNRYLKNEDKWDLNYPTPIFVNWSKSLKNKKKILIPGAGKGHDAIYLAEKGHDVYAVDFSIQATNYITKIAQNKNIDINVINANLFSLQKYYNYFDILLEYTFYCAISPSKRSRYIKESYNLLKNNGEFVGIFLPINKTIKEGGPPFAVNITETINKFTKYYKIIECCKSTHSIKERAENEIYISMKKCIK